MVTIDRGAGIDVIASNGWGRADANGGLCAIGHSTGEGIDCNCTRVRYGGFDFTPDAFFCGGDIGILCRGNQNELSIATFSQDGVGADRSVQLTELSFTGVQHLAEVLITVLQKAANAQKDTMEDGTVFNACRATAFADGGSIDSFEIQSTSGATTGLTLLPGDWADGVLPPATDCAGGNDVVTGGAGADTRFIASSASDGAGLERQRCRGSAWWPRRVGRG